jgi:hypothetical protein
MRTDACPDDDVDWILDGKACILGRYTPTSGLTSPFHPPQMFVNCLFSLGVEHSLSKRKVDGSNPSIGFWFFWFFGFFVARPRARGVTLEARKKNNYQIPTPT